MTTTEILKRAKAAAPLLAMSTTYEKNAALLSMAGLNMGHAFGLRYERKARLLGGWLLLIMEGASKLNP